MHVYDTLTPVGTDLKKRGYVHDINSIEGYVECESLDHLQPEEF
jgi:hypothetical protein